MLPKSGGLATHIPQSESVVSVLDGLHIEAYCWHGLFKLLVSHLKK